jgi:hypothetical protein
MKTFRFTNRPPAEHGYVLYIVLLSLTLLSVVAGQIIMRVRDSYRAIHRAANWQQALTTADAGVDIAIAQLTSTLPDVRVNSQETVGLSVPQNILSVLDTGISLQPGSSGLPLNLNLTLTPPPLVIGGEGNTSQQARVSIEVLPVDAVPNTLLSVLSGNLSLQLVRIRSTGIAYLDPNRTAGYEKAENDLRRPILNWDREARQTVDRPYVARTVEVTLRPALPFESGVVSLGALQVDNDTASFDSFNSVLPTASTLGRYDAAKRLQSTTVQTNSAQLTLPGFVYGNLYTNGGTAQKTNHITGSVANDRYRSTPPMRDPSWSGSAGAPTLVLLPTTLSAGSLLLPARYKFTSVNNTLHITKGMLGLGTNVDIWVTGDFAGRLVVDAGIQARVYVSGDIATGSGDWQNGSHRAANLQIYGLKPGPGKGNMAFSLGTDMEATIYAPEHTIVFTGGGNLSGSVTGGTVWIKSGAQFHFDEALALNVGPLLGFDLVSWKEILPQ